MTTEISHSRSRRRFAALIGALPFSGAFAGRVNPIPVPPCFFPFDASREGEEIEKTFMVEEPRFFNFMLVFKHQGGAEAESLYEIMDDRQIIVTKESADSEKPIVVTREMAGIGPREGYEKIYMGVNSGVYVRKATNFRGVLALELSVSQLLGETVTEIVPKQVFQTNGVYSGGNGSFVRRITGVALKRGTYRMRAKAKFDAKEFFGKPIYIGVSFYQKAKSLPE